MKKDDARVLITGGASGIGHAITEWCKTQGYETITLDKNGGDIEADLTSRAETKEALDEALRGGPIHRLVNNVGVVLPATLAETSTEDMSLSYELNVRCALQCMQALLPGMEKRSFGRVVNISSRAILGKLGRTSYASSKAALIGMTRTWALELGQKGITVNALAPGPIATDLFYKANSPEEQQSIIDSVPVGRVGHPEDIANATSYLLDDNSSFITGQTLYVCGGTSIQQSLY